MGIQGLLPLMKSIMVPFHIKDLHGCSVAVDTYSWLHKGALCCSKDLCMGFPTSRHIDYCMHRVNLLRHHGVKPILVFDGGLLPMKSDEETKRSRARKENLERAIEHESTGNSAAAYECYQKAVDISPSVAFKLIQVLKVEKVDYVVAPYEADAQMAFLCLNKTVDAVITEDSDLIPFGCSRIIFKMDKFGQGVEFRYSMIERNKEMNFSAFTRQMLLEMCILSGCDYLHSLPGLGLKRAHALMRKFKSYDKVIKHLRYSAISVPPLYEEDFKKAMLTFQHQRVYDPTSEDIVHLTSIPNDLGSDLDFLGPSIPQSVVIGIAKGDLDPFTKLPFQGESICAGLVHEKTYPVKEFKLENKRKKSDLSTHNNVLTNYFSSLEAKRNFKVPRVIPKHLRSTYESSPSITNHGSDFSSVAEAVVCTINCSQGSLTDSGNSQDALPFKDSVEDDFATEGNKLLEFQHDVGRNVTSDVKENLNCLEYAVMRRQSNGDTVRPSMELGENHLPNSSLEVVDDRTVKRKVIIRSRYFETKLLDKNDNDNENEKLVVEEEDASSVLCGNTVPKSVLLGNNYMGSSSKKRKSTSSQNIRSGTAKAMGTLANSMHSRENNGIPDLSSKFMEADTKDGNFGCDISHLSQYSDIAEKSMERFVSVMSSFRYVASGSRASGLRAPLKDVKNTCAVRLPVMPMDLSKFAYVSNNKRAASASRMD
ncbi:exonuclease 1 isoform X2 [Magnolia sinica]|uniref:exonuclease 1 isoform X2 n=1 Tax=Magnolia sinica TaxID=86752 RepID=UPI002659104F|nr:exonuclease 1 isoform X2 [Magnolia sinica]